MLKSCVKAYKFFFDLFKYYPEPTAQVVEYFSCEKNKKSSTLKNNNKIIAVEGVYDPLFLSLFGAIIIDLKKRSDVKVDFLWVHSISWAVGVGLVPSILRNKIIGFFRSLQWYHAYQIFADDVAYFSTTLLNPIRELQIFLETRTVYKNLKFHQDISSFKYDGVLIGDLIVDTYLRFRPSPKFNINDKFVKIIISQCIRDLKKSSWYFSRKKPKIYMTSHSTYIQHGIPVRVALNSGVDVRCFAGPHVFCKYLSPDDFYHSLNCDSFRIDFAKLDDQTSRKKQADAFLINRFSGAIDASTSYMKTSAYAFSDSCADEFNVNGHVIIFLHDFYDSPHFYGDFIFQDFWSWLVTTIDVLSRANIKFSIKPHPNQTPDSDKAVKRLISNYPNLNVLSGLVSNKNLVESGMVCGVTVFGTVAHELAYFGVPTICCAKNAHYQYDFCRTASSVDEYKEFLLSPDFLPIPVDKMRDQALEFVYMQNLHFSKEEHAFREKIATYYSKFTLTQKVNDFEPLLDELRSLPYYQKLVNDVRKVLD